MDFPNKFKSFEECQKFFQDKSVTIFHGVTYVLISHTPNDGIGIKRCIYEISGDGSLSIKNQNKTKETVKEPTTTKTQKKTKDTKSKE